MAEREPGELVREKWLEWARRQPDPKPSWLVPWKDLDKGQREVGAEIEAAVRADERRRLANRAAMVDEVKHELEDAFQFTNPGGSRHSYVSREWVEALLATHAASAGAAECQRIRDLARKTMAVCTGDEGTQCYFEALLGEEVPGA